MALAANNSVVFSHKLSIKLDNENFLLWRPQFVSADKGHQLLNFISPNFTPPQKFLSDRDEEAGLIDPQFVQWEIQDQLLSSMSEGILTHVVGCETSAQFTVNE
ncbi:hypothetical protein CsatA_005733 [Cannabis sativa]